MKTRASFAMAALLGVSLIVPGRSDAATKFQVDGAHTNVLFHVRHLFTEVTGRFGKFEGTIVLDKEDPSQTHVEGKIDAASIDTNNEKRDNHLRSKDFFEVEKYPEITFRSTAVTDVDREKKTAKMAGLLKIRDVERRVVFDVEYLGEGKDPWGNSRGGFRGTTVIDRKDFGLNWNEALEAGGFLVGDEVRIEINAEGLAQP